MSTRSNIIVHHTDGRWSNSYCHFDGYVLGVGKILLEHYKSQERAEALAALGDLSSLEPSIEKPDGHSFDTKIDGYTVAYGRDRGEKDTGPNYYQSLAEAWPDSDNGAEFVYVWDDGHWKVGDPDDQSHKLGFFSKTGRGQPKTAIKAFGVNYVIGHR